jgi:RNA polymerase sigma-70 factor (ECF subfamily)
LPTPPPADFSALVERCRRRERAAQEELYARFAPRLLAVCCRYAPSRAQAEDLLQDAFIRIFNALDQFRADGPLEAWLRRIVVRTAITHFHSTRNRTQYEVDLEEAADAVADDYDALSRLRVEDIRAMIHQLPEKCRLVLNLYCFEGFSHREIADALGIEEKTSSSQLFKARQRLLTLLRRDEYALSYGPES